MSDLQEHLRPGTNWWMEHEHLLDNLDDVEKAAIVARHGMGGGGLKTLKQTGDVIGASVEETRLILARALRRARHEDKLERSKRIHGERA